MLELPRVLAIIKKNEQGQFRQIHESLELHREPMINIIPDAEGVFVVLGLLDEVDNNSLMNMLRTLSSTQVLNPVHSTASISGETQV